MCGFPGGLIHEAQGFIASARPGRLLPAAHAVLAPLVALLPLAPDEHPAVEVAVEHLADRGCRPAADRLDPPRGGAGRAPSALRMWAILRIPTPSAARANMRRMTAASRSCTWRMTCERRPL